MSIEQTREILSHEELSDADIVHLLGLTDPEECELLRKTAYDRTTELMGSFVYYRGLIEFSNICTASCRYCGIRRENHDVERYTMSKEEIVAAAKWAADQGYGSICLQSGERRDEKYIAFVESCLEAIHEATVSEKLPDGVGVTLSLGEQTIETYRRLAKASGNPSNLRYLARFETSNPELFKVLHGARGDHEKELQNRFRMLRDLREAGYQVGTGVMIGIPGQSLEDLCRGCDYLTVHVPSKADTIGMISTEQIDLLAPDAVLINYARETIIDEDAVDAALREGKLSWFSCDFATPKTVKMPNTFITTHSGAGTGEAEANCADMAISELKDYLENGNIAHSVNYPACSMGKARAASRIACLHANVPNMIGQITAILAKDNANVQRMTNESAGENAYTMFDTDEHLDGSTIEALKHIPSMYRVRVIK